MKKQKENKQYYLYYHEKYGTCLKITNSNIKSKHNKK